MPNPKFTKAERECYALTAELVCIKRGREKCKADECKSQIHEVIEDVEDSKNYYCDSWDEEKKKK